MYESLPLRDEGPGEEGDASSCSVSAGCDRQVSVEKPWSEAPTDLQPVARRRALARRGRQRKRIEGRSIGALLARLRAGRRGRLARKERGDGRQDGHCVVCPNHRETSSATGWAHGRLLQHQKSKTDERAQVPVREGSRLRRKESVMSRRCKQVEPVLWSPTLANGVVNV